jgi:hypothetical protein
LGRKFKYALESPQITLRLLHERRCYTALTSLLDLTTPGIHIIEDAIDQK